MHKLTDKEKNKINELYKLGKMDSEIGKELGICRATIQYYRKTHNMPTKFTYEKISKIDNIKFEKLFNEGLSDYSIAKELNMSPDGVYSHRMRHGYFRESLKENKPIPLTDFQKQVLIGTMLGDSSFKMSKDKINPAVSCAHCIQQREYCEYKTQIFESLGAKCHYHKRNIPDKRNGKFYEDYTMLVPSNPEFLDFYTKFYKNGRKVIPFELLDNFTEVSLAFMFMDDGSKTKCGYVIATNCFNKDELTKFRAFLIEKFGIETSLHKNNVLYIKANSKDTFTNIVNPYIIPCMQYKLHN